MQKALCLAARGRRTFTETIRIMTSRKTGSHRSNVRSFLLAMKITAFLLTVACLHAFAGSDAQITISEKDVPLSKVFQEIRKQSGFQFLYPESIMQSAGTVTLTIVNATVEEAVQKSLEGKNLEYTIVEKTVIIKERPQTADLSPRLNKKNPLLPISGVVKDVDGKPLANVSVTVKGTEKGTTTDAEGKFSVDVKEGDVLVVSSVGFGSKEVKINAANASLVIALDISSSPLDEVQIIAYGETSKRLQTGNVSSVKQQDIERQPVQNPLLALQGLVPGINIVQNTGLPGSGIKIRIQGQNSLAQGIDPLIVIDGVQYPYRTLPTLSNVVGKDFAQSPDAYGAGSPLSYINPMDVASIEVLKDADATAIYGSRGGNGVIIITTKKAKEGKMKTDFHFQKGIGKVTRKADLLNTDQYVQLRKEAYLNDGLPVPSDVTVPDFSNYDLTVWDQHRYTDWQKVLIGNTAKYTNAQISLSGGSINTQYLVSATYHKQTTVFPGDLADTKGSWNLNLNTVSADKKLQFGIGVKYQIDDNKIINTDLTEIAMKLPPNAPELFEPNGTLNWAMYNGMATWNNPLSYLPNRYKNRTNNLLADATVSYKLGKALEFRIPFGYLYQQADQTSIFLMSSRAPDIRPFELNSSLAATGNMTNLQVEPQLSYQKNIGKGRFTGLLGATVLENSRNQNTISAYGFSSDLVIYNLAAASSKNILPAVRTKYRYNALFGRINYTLKERYVFNVNVRRDGSSRFGEENRFHNFGSLGAAWIFSNEPAFEALTPFLSFGKIRSSYGSTGNDQIGEYQFLSIYNPVVVQTPYQGITAFVPDRLPNSNLKWEEIRKLSFGMDLGFFHDRVLLHADYYRNKSANQLVSYKLPIITGFNSIMQNFPAVVENYGYEFSLSTQNIKNSKISWNTDFNISFNRNKLIEFSDLAFSSYAPFLTIGQPITIRKVYDFYSVDPATGIYQFMDKEGKLTEDPGFGNENRSVIIDPAPKYYGGFTNRISYKGFELDVLFQFVKQIGLTNRFGNQPGTLSSFAYDSQGNQPVTVLDRWQRPGDIKGIQKLGSIFFYYPSLNYIMDSDAAWVDASYIRLKNLSVSWQLPKHLFNKVGIQAARIFIQGQNLLTFSNYDGLDPETLSQGTLPPLSIITVGATVTM